MSQINFDEFEKQRANEFKHIRQQQQDGNIAGRVISKFIHNLMTKKSYQITTALVVLYLLGTGIYYTLKNIIYIFL